MTEPDATESPESEPSETFGAPAVPPRPLDEPETAEPDVSEEQAVEDETARRIAGIGDD